MICKKETTRGPIYKLMFFMDHNDMRKIEKDLKIRRKNVDFVMYSGFIGNSHKTVRYVG